MAEKKNTRGKGFIIKNIGDLSRQHTLVGAERPPLILNNNLPIRGGDKVSAPYAGKPHERYITPVVYPPEVANLQLDFDARDPGVSNVPKNIGLSSEVGSLTGTGTAYGWTATGGPANGPRWFFNTTGYYQNLVTGVVIGDGLSEVTMAVILRTDLSKNANIFGADDGPVGSNTVLGEQQQPGYSTTSHRYEVEGVYVGTTLAVDIWEVVIMRSRVPGVITRDLDMLYLELGDTAVAVSNLNNNIADQVHLGSRVWFGGTNFSGDFDGDIARAMCWDKWLGDTEVQELIDYINAEYGL